MELRVAAVVALAGLLAGRSTVAAPPENLAAKAVVSATSVHDDRFLPKFAVDGVVPPRDSRETELHRAWCVLARPPQAAET